MTGTQPLAGDHRGRESLLRYLGAFDRNAGHRVRRVAQVILANDLHCASFVRVTAGTGPQAVGVLEAEALRVGSDGRFCEYWAVTDGRAAMDEFLL